MAFRRTRMRRRRRPRRFRRRGPRVNRVSRGTGVTSLSLKRGVGVPDRYTTLLQYSTYVRLDTAGSGASARRLFRGNSVFDPDQAIGGQQPTYFDQLAALYTHYMVWGSKIVVHVVSSEDTLNTGPGNLIVVLPARSTTPSADMQVAIQQPRAKYRLFRDSSDNVYVIRNSARSKQMLLAGPSGWSNSLTSLTTGNPGDMWYWHILANSANATAECVVDVQVKIYYYVTFYERAQIVGS